MGFRVDFDELCELGFAVQSKVTGWGDQLTAVQSALESLTGLESFRGGGAEAVKAYVDEVHGVILVSLGEILAEVSARFLLFKDGYHQVDTDLHARLDESTLDDQARFFVESRQGFDDAHRRVQTAAASVADLVGLDVPSSYGVTDGYAQVGTDLLGLKREVSDYEIQHMAADFTYLDGLIVALRGFVGECVVSGSGVVEYVPGSVLSTAAGEALGVALEAAFMAREALSGVVGEAAARERDRMEVLRQEWDEERVVQGWLQLAMGALVVAGGVACIVMTAGAATPLVVTVAGGVAGMATVAGRCTVAKVGAAAKGVIEYGTKAGIGFGAGYYTGQAGQQVALSLGASESVAQLVGLGTGLIGGAATGVAVNWWQWSYKPGSIGIRDGVCFIPGTPVLTPTGLVAIETLRVGDLVVSTNPTIGHTTGQPITETYTRTTTELIHLTISNHVTSVTPEHPYWVPDTGWVKAKDLTPGDQLLTSTKGIVTVDSTIAEILDTPTTVHNLEIADYHTYHASNTPVLVHNAGYGSANGEPGIEGTLFDGEIPRADSLRRTETVRRQIEEMSKGGIPARPYSDSPGTTMLLDEIMQARTPVKDQVLSNGVRWDVPGAMNGTRGTGQLVVDLDTNRIVHFVFVS